MFTFLRGNLHILIQKWILGDRNLRFYQKKYAQSHWAFVLVCLYCRVYAGKG